MDNIKVSVIIPVYNVAPYLGECLDSVINQTLKEIEIICIDDCSTDNSYQILEEYAKKDSRIILLQNEKNTKGPATGRNKGIDLAKGEYIYFIDSDDYIENIFLEEMYNTAKKYNTDIVSNLNIIENENGNLNYYKHSIYNFLNEKEIKNKEFLEGKSDINIKNFKDGTKEEPFVVVWNKIYKRESIIKNNIYFLIYTKTMDYSAEDNHFIYNILLHKLTFSYNHRAKYFYRKVSSSLSNKKNSIASYYFRMINIIENFHSYQDIQFLYKKIFNSICWQFNNCIINNTKVDNINKEYYYLHDISNKINLNKRLLNSIEYLNYIIIKSNDTYEKYLLQKDLFESINNIKNKLNQLDTRVKQTIEKQDTRLKLFGIEKFNNKAIIYFFGIKITIKKKN